MPSQLIRESIYKRVIRKTALKSVASTAVLKRTIKALQAQIAEVDAIKVSEDSAEESVAEPTKPTKKLKTLKRDNKDCSQFPSNRF